MNAERDGGGGGDGECPQQITITNVADPQSPNVTVTVT